MDQGQQLAARMGGTGALAQVDQRIGQLLDAEPPSQQAGSASPALATVCLSSKATASRSRLWEDGIEKVPS
jgi:hypothetical protein